MSNRRFFVVVWVLVLTPNLGNFDDAPSEGNGEKFNVVLFFAKTSTCETYNSGEGLTCFNFTEKIRVKHSVGDTNENSLSEYTSSGSDCKQLLRASLVSLISYCKNVMGMTTSIASMENDTFSNGLRFRRSIMEDNEILYHHPRRSRGRIFYNFRPLKDKVLITAPEHTEVFKIRSKREYHVEEASPPQTTPKWDILGTLVGSINLTFFGKLLEGNKEEQEQSSKQLAQSNAMNQKNRVYGNTLFNLVKESLSSVQDDPSGFLMIVLGGNLSDISDPYSDLVQGVKHVVENTNEENTLIVVTGFCPVVESDVTENDNFTIPVYVRGCQSVNSLKFTSKIYDVPFCVKSILADMNKPEGNYFASVKARRAKRNIFKEKRNGSFSILPSLILAITSQMCTRLELYQYLKEWA